ncbi:unnamed protein product [Zymoseptoria tritici ST99CH_3D1]|nr:unnamed protein product [Zymoseptoria tritici ST99CH_1E4]SMR43996.1 unnamed protein product [Zymoseptoria tritici ST99CH_3D1]
MSLTHQTFDISMTTTSLHNDAINDQAYQQQSMNTQFNDFSLFESAIYRQALALLQQSTEDSSKHHSNANFRSADTDRSVTSRDWQPLMYQNAYNSMGGSATAHTQQNKGLKGSKSHRRTPSTSTVESAGPSSPFMQNGFYPQIANTDTDPTSQANYYLDSAYGKHLATASETPQEASFGNAALMPSQAAHMSNAHLAMKGFAIDYHNSDDFASDFAPSRQSMSSYGNDSPATPQSGAGENDNSKNYNNGNGNGNEYRTPNPNVQLFRTESEAFRDELYNPNVTFTNPVTAKQPTSNSYLSPNSNLITQRLQTANLARSTSPSGLGRERSPFRDNSPMASDWRTPAVAPVTTAASIRRQQNDSAVAAELGKQRVPLRREPTKTISPKDALLDYTHDPDQTPLFQDSAPAGYEKHGAAAEQWPVTNFLNQQTPAFNGQQNMGFRNASSAENGFSNTAFNFPSLPQADEIQNAFQVNYPSTASASLKNYSEPAPAFPASIPSMETSISDAGPPASSQESVDAPTSAPKRPDDTRANTGTYTCTYHGCTQRFDSHMNLQKHKRDFHRSHQPQQVKDEGSPSSVAESESSRPTESPEPSGAGMTSAAILARNSQAGPHKCTRINPSTNKPCNTIFSRPYDLTRHEDTIHNGRKQKVRCPMCREEKTFSRNDALTRHMRVVHPEVEEFGKRGKRG